MLGKRAYYKIPGGDKSSGAVQSRPITSTRRNNPVSEALRIPDVGEVVAAHVFANQLVRRAAGFEPLLDTRPVATTDVHEYGKLLIESVLSRINVAIVDVGVCTDPRDLGEMLLDIPRQRRMAAT
ncbi:hypothetical protein ACFL1S_02050 [Pseudomonadota bacterium]